MPDAQSVTFTKPHALTHSHTVAQPFGVTEPITITFEHAHPKPEYDPHVHRAHVATEPAVYPAERRPSE